MDDLTKKPHIHAEAIKAWADGAEIERYLETSRIWYTTDYPSWDEKAHYRVKEAQKPDTVMEVEIVLSLFAGPLMYAAAPSEANCNLVFDGTTNKLVRAEVKGLKEAFKQPSEGFSSSSEGLGSLNPFKRTGEL